MTTVSVRSHALYGIEDLSKNHLNINKNGNYTFKTPDSSKVGLFTFSVSFDYWNWRINPVSLKPIKTAKLKNHFLFEEDKSIGVSFFYEKNKVNTIPVCQGWHCRSIQIKADEKKTVSPIYSEKKYRANTDLPSLTTTYLGRGNELTLLVNVSPNPEVYISGPKGAMSPFVGIKEVDESYVNKQPNRIFKIISSKYRHHLKLNSHSQQIKTTQTFIMINMDEKLIKKYENRAFSAAGINGEPNIFKFIGALASGIDYKKMNGVFSDFLKEVREKNKYHVLQIHP